MLLYDVETGTLLAVAQPGMLFPLPYWRGDAISSYPMR